MASPAELKAAYFGELTPEAARAVCQVSRRTWRRWHQSDGRPPNVYIRLLCIIAQGELPAGGPDWSGWFFHRGELYSPERVRITPGQMRALPYLYALIAELQRKNKKQTGGGSTVNINTKRISGSGAA